MYSRKKPYQRKKESPVYFYNRGVRLIKESPQKESMFEKPYLNDYGDMQQGLDETPGVGELVCMYDPEFCDVTVGCFAGEGISIVGSKEEEAGYEEPKVVDGAIISWEIGEDKRELYFDVDPLQDKNIIDVTFIDGEGDPITTTVEMTCESSLIILTEDQYPRVDLTIDHDSSGYIYVLYSDSLDSKMRLTSNETGEWVTQQISHGVLDVTQAAGALDSSDNLYVVYSDESNSKLYYRDNVGGSWNSAVEIFDYGASIDNPKVHMDVDSSGKARVVHMYSKWAEDDTRIYYTSNSTGSWQDSLAVNYLDGTGFYNARIRMDSGDAIHIVYQTDDQGGNADEIRYVTGTPGSWSDVLALASAANAGVSRLVHYVDSSDKVHIAHEGTWKVAYLTNATGSWVNEAVSNEFSRPCGITMKSDGVVCIVYGITSGFNPIKVARGNAGAWEIFTIDGTVNRIAVGDIDSTNGNANVVYALDYGSKHMIYLKINAA
jgi:hypothetical protein